MKNILSKQCWRDGIRNSIANTFYDHGVKFYNIDYLTQDIVNKFEKRYIITERPQIKSNLFWRLTLPFLWLIIGVLWLLIPIKYIITGTSYYDITFIKKWIAIFDGKGKKI